MEKKKDKLFLVIAILLTLVFLVDTPNNLTGAATTETANGEGQFIGLMLFLLLITIVVYIFHLIKKPGTEVWHLAPLESQDDEPSDTELDQVNRKLLDLRDMKSKRPRKFFRGITKLPNIKEKMLSKELKEINDEVHGYHKPIVIKVPKARKELSQNLDLVREQISRVDNMEIKKVKFREKIPTKKGVKDFVESKQINEELNDIKGALKSGLLSILPKRKIRYEPALQDISKKLSNLDQGIEEVNFRENVPVKKGVTDYVETKQLNKELSDIKSALKNGLRSILPKKKIKKSTALKEIDEKISKLDENIKEVEVKVSRNVKVKKSVKDFIESDELSKELKTVQKALKDGSSLQNSTKTKIIKQMNSKRKKELDDVDKKLAQL